MTIARVAAACLAIGLFGCHAAQKAIEPVQADEPTSKPSAPSMVIGLGPGFELAPRATYSASQKAGEVTIKAIGENPTPGYEMKLVQRPLRIWPPQWMLGRKRPDGMAAQVITPFEVSASFKSDEPVKAVTVMDAAGRHKVDVEQAGN